MKTWNKYFEDLSYEEEPDGDDEIWVLFKLGNGWEPTVSSYWKKEDAEKAYIEWVNRYYHQDINNFDDAINYHEENYGGDVQVFLEKSNLK